MPDTELTTKKPSTNKSRKNRYYFLFKKEGKDFILLDILTNTNELIIRISDDIKKSHIIPDVFQFIKLGVDKKLNVNLNIKDRYKIQNLNVRRSFDLNKGVYLIRVNNHLNTNIIFKDLNEVSMYLKNLSSESNDFSIIFWNKTLAID